MVKKNNVNHPKHYNNHPSGIECIDIVRHENFNCGSAIKYIWRRGEKVNEIEDLQKAIWYLQNEIERVKKFDKWDMYQKVQENTIEIKH